MYRSTIMTLRPDPARISSRAEHVDVELALPAPVSPDYQVRHVPKPALLLGSDVVEDDVDEVLLIPDDPEEGEEDTVQMVAPVAVEGGKTMPIDVELLPLTLSASTFSTFSSKNRKPRAGIPNHLDGG